MGYFYFSTSIVVKGLMMLEHLDRAFNCVQYPSTRSIVITDKPQPHTLQMGNGFRKSTEHILKEALNNPIPVYLVIAQFVPKSVGSQEITEGQMVNVYVAEFCRGYLTPLSAERAKEECDCEVVQAMRLEKARLIFCSGSYLFPRDKEAGIRGEDGEPLSEIAR